MTQFLQLRSGTSGAPFVGVSQDDVLLWDITQKKWFVGAFPSGILTTDEILNVSLVPGFSASDALDNVGVNPNFPPPFDNGNSGATKTISFASSLSQKLTLTANCTLTVTGLIPNRTQWPQMTIVQGGGGGFTLAVVGAETPGAAGLTLSAAPGAKDVVSGYWDGTVLGVTVGGLAFA